MENAIRNSATYQKPLENPYETDSIEHRYKEKEMSIINLRKKPLLLKDVKIEIIGDDKTIVMMNLETIDHKTVTVGMLPSVAFAMLEELSITTLGVTKRDKKDKEIMYR